MIWFLGALSPFGNLSGRILLPMVPLVVVDGALFLPRISRLHLQTSGGPVVLAYSIGLWEPVEAIPYGAANRYWAVPAQRTLQLRIAVAARLTDRCEYLPMVPRGLLLPHRDRSSHPTADGARWGARVRRALRPQLAAARRAGSACRASAERQAASRPAGRSKC